MAFIPSSFIKLLPPPPRISTCRPCTNPPSMLSKSAVAVLINVRNGLAKPLRPPLPHKDHFSANYNLYIDIKSRMAAILWKNNNRFIESHALSLVKALDPLFTSTLIDCFVVAVSPRHRVSTSAFNCIQRHRGEIVAHDISDILNSHDRQLQTMLIPDLTRPSFDLLTDRIADTLINCNSETSAKLFVPNQLPVTPPRSPQIKRRRTRLNRRFELHAQHSPAGDQPKAIKFLTDGLLMHEKPYQTLHGVTGSGKTFMMASIIASVNRPTLVLAPNKTLAVQLCNEFSNYFPNNRVEFFVSNFKYYQPEAYLPNTDKYIAKHSAIDPEIDRLRHAATKSLFERTDTIVVASVSSIYGLGLPTEYLEASIILRIGDKIDARALVQQLRTLNYIQAKDDILNTRGLFYATAQSISFSPPWESEGSVYRIALDDNGYISKMEKHATSEEQVTPLDEELVIYPAKHFFTPKERVESAVGNIEKELKLQVNKFTAEGKMLEAARLEDRVLGDIEMLKKVGFCHGVENYSLHLSGRDSNTPPETLLDYMPKDGKWLLFVDESHVTVPQLGSMHAGNAARKKNLIQHGFRLPSAVENRPLSGQEFWRKTHQAIFVSATPSAFEFEKSGSDGVVEAVIRPTAVVDPTVEVVGTTAQIEHLTVQLAKVAASGGKAIVTTITKRFAEDIADCLSKKKPVEGVLDRPLVVSFLHSGIDSVARMQVLEAMRDETPSCEGDVTGDEQATSKVQRPLDVVVGVNLLREGIDLPAVQLVAILDADAEGFLRGETALIQTMGRAARNINGHVIMYADTMTTAMERSIAETSRRRKLQMAFNAMYNISPSPITKRTSVSENGEEDTVLNRIRKLRLGDQGTMDSKALGISDSIHRQRELDRRRLKTDASFNSRNSNELRAKMLQAAKDLDFETAALLRDRLQVLENNGHLKDIKGVNSKE